MRAAPFLLSLAGALPAQDPSAERLLATIPADLALTSDPIPAPDGSKQVDHAQFAFGAGGRFVAYIAYRGAKGVAVVGDKVLGEYHYLHAPVMDAAGEHFAFRAGNRVQPTKEQWWAIVDGQQGKPFDWIGEVALGAGGAAVFWEQPGAKLRADGAYDESPMLLHFGSKTTKKYDSPLSLIAPTFSADGSIVATCGARGGRQVPFTFDQKKEVPAKQAHDLVEDVVCSPDGRRLAVVAVVGGMPLEPGEPGPPDMAAGKWRIAVDGKSYGDGDDDVGAPVWSRDGKRLAFKVRRGGKMGIGTDQEPKPPCAHDFVGVPVFDASGQQLLFIGQNGGSDASGLARWRDPGAVGGRCSLSNRTRNGKVEVLVDDADGLAHPTFGPDGRIAFAQKRGDKWHVRVGAIESPGFDDVGPPVFAADGKRLAFGARVGRELWWKVLALQ